MNAKPQIGFTLIELVLVIVILGILAATALPKFVDLKSDAQLAAIQSVAGAVSSAFAINYAARAVNATKGVAVAGTVTVNAVAGSILVGGMPSGYILLAGAATSASTVACGTTTGTPSAGAVIPVTVSNAGNVSSAATAAATLICTG